MMQLARVQTRTPRLLPLATADGSAVRVVVQIRPTALHFLQDGVLLCVVHSPDEICGVAPCGPLEAATLHVAVATSSGVVWLVRLPVSPVGVKPIVLKSSPLGSHAAVRRLVDVPGVQQLVYVPHLDVLVCTSLLVPTTVIRGLLQVPRQHSLEMDDLDGERSTSLCVFSAEQHPRIASWLLVGSTRSADATITIVQGDGDGAVRCAVVQVGSSMVVERAAELIRLPEPVHSLLPVRLESDKGADALLVVGSRGSLRLLSHGSTHPHILCGQLGSSVISVGFIDYQDPLIVVLTATQKILAIPMTQLLANLRVDMSSSNDTNRIVSQVSQMSQFEDVMLLCANADAAMGVCLLTRSGSVLSVRRDELLARLHQSTTATARDAIPTDVRVKTLLQDISRVSVKSTKLRQASDSADALLLGLKSGLDMIHLVEERGIDSIVTCSMRLKLVNDGWAMQSKGIRLLISLKLTEALSPARFLPSKVWRLQVTVGSDSIVASYGFPLHDCIGTTKSVELDKSMLQPRDGLVQITCEVLFAPHMLGVEVDGFKSQIDADKLISFGVPVIQAQDFHLVQLSEPVPDFPTNPAALQEMFTHSLESQSNEPARQGHQWWSLFFGDAAATGVAFSDDDAAEIRDKAAPPLRIVTRVFMRQTGSDLVSSLAENDIISLICRLMNAESDSERLEWRAACRQLNGKWWVGMRTLTRNLIVLRFTISAVEPTAQEGDVDKISIAQCIEIAAHASNSADLAAMRALILHRLVNLPSENIGVTEPMRHAERTSVALTNVRSELNRLAATMADIHQKTASSASLAPHNESQAPFDMCQEELLQLIRRTGQVESRALELYWRSREVLGQHLTL